MNIKYMLKEYKLNDSTKEKVENKIESRLKKYKMNNENLNINLKVTDRKPFINVVLSFVYHNYKVNSECGTTDDIVIAVDKCLEGIERQIRKYKTRIMKSKHSGKNITDGLIGESIPDDSAESTADDMKEVVKVENYDAKPMSIEDAILQMELLEYKFFVFHDMDKDGISVIYKRDDGRIGLIEP